MELVRHTYEKRIGLINLDQLEPVVEIAGRAWYTRGLLPIVIPDQMYDDPWPGEKTPLPSGVVIARSIYNGEVVAL